MNFTAAVVAMAETAAAVVTGLDDALVTAWDSTDVLSPINKDEEEVEEVQEVE
jgi:ABC-type thiamine transport system substrate-binding protein